MLFGAKMSTTKPLNGTEWDQPPAWVQSPTLAALTYPVCFIFLLLFTCLSFCLFRSTLGFPFPKFPLSFLTLVVGENVRKDAPGNGFNGVLWNTGIVHELLFAGKVFFFPPVQYEIFRMRMCERYVVAGMAPSMLNRKCRHLSSRSHLRVCICYSFMPWLYQNWQSLSSKSGA